MLKKQFVDKEKKENGATQREMERKSLDLEHWIFNNQPISRRKQRLLTDFIMK